jgi:hypothetical protein
MEVFGEAFRWKRDESSKAGKNYEELFKTCRGVGPHPNRGY